jgi:hypothetical protein
MVNLTITQISSLKKVRTQRDIAGNMATSKAMLRGEKFCWQYAIETDDSLEIQISINSPFAEKIRLYSVKNIYMDFPIYVQSTDDDLITRKPGMMPDLLVPLEKQNGYVKLAESVSCIWVELNVPGDFPPGKYPVTLIFHAQSTYSKEKLDTEQTMYIEVIDAKIPAQKTIFTQWFYADCIADAHNVEVYSEKHWELIEKYMALAARLGINMLLTPIITPPLDTKVGTCRPNTQLVRITAEGDKYSFDFSLLKRWISLCRKCGIKYYEMAHLYSQWGLKYAPNIYVWENGILKHKFGWHVTANDKSYTEFLQQFIPALVKFLKQENIANQCYFHISDEPNNEQLQAYRDAYDVVKPLIGELKCFDALSDIEFFNEGLITCPVTATNHIEPFLDKNKGEQWAYYCSAQYEKVGNRFLCMPSYRNRILGIQLYKYGIKGFLQWGYNFYYSQLSLYPINPYVTSSAEMALPSGDAFSVYPGDNEPYPSLRTLIFSEALQDIELCRLLESYMERKRSLSLLKI